MNKERKNEYKIPIQVSIPKLRYAKTGPSSKLESPIYPRLQLTALQIALSRLEKCEDPKAPKLRQNRHETLCRNMSNQVQQFGRKRL